MQWKNIPGRSKIQDKVRESKGQKMEPLIFCAEEYPVYPVDDVEPMDRFQWGTGFECVFLSSLFSSPAGSCLSVH